MFILFLIIKLYRYYMAIINQNPFWDIPQWVNKLLRAPCTYPRGKTTGYYGAEKQKTGALGLKSKPQKISRPCQEHGE